MIVIYVDLSDLFEYRRQMATVQQVLDRKGPEVWSVHPRHSVYDAIQKMAEKNIGSLVVLEGDQIVGILTERHYARHVILEGRSSLETPVRDIMVTPVVCVRLDQTIEECMAIMTEKRIRHLPVVDENRLVGLVSIGDLVKTTIADQEFTIEQLIHYIQG